MVVTVKVLCRWHNETSSVILLLVNLITSIMQSPKSFVKMLKDSCLSNAWITLLPLPCWSSNSFDYFVEAHWYSKSTLSSSWNGGPRSSYGRQNQCHLVVSSVRPLHPPEIWLWRQLFWCLRGWSNVRRHITSLQDIGVLSCIQNW